MSSSARWSTNSMSCRDGECANSAHLYAKVIDVRSNKMSAKGHSLHTQHSRACETESRARRVRFDVR